MARYRNEQTRMMPTNSSPELDPSRETSRLQRQYECGSIRGDDY